MLVQALYGHPEAGAHWEDHFKAILKGLGGEVVPAYPSTFWFAEDRLLLTVYVDDIMLSGPAEKHEPFWERLQQQVKLDDPEPLDRFLGRHHELNSIRAPAVDIRRYFDPQPKDTAADVASGGG